MKRFTILMLAVVLLAFAGPALADDIDFVEGQKIPGTLKADRTHSGAQTFSGTNTFTGANTFTGNFMGTPPDAQTIGSGGTIAADACGTIKIISAAGGVTTDTTNSFTAPSASLAGCCMILLNSSANTITIDENTLTDTVGSGNLAVTQLDTVMFCCDGTTWRQITALLSNN